MRLYTSLALDADGTLTTGDEVAIRHLLEDMKRRKVPVYLNTARLGPRRVTEQVEMLRWIPEHTRHLCRTPTQDVRQAKVLNLHYIRAREGTQHVILVDDLADNVHAALEAGFSGVHAASGIDWTTVAHVHALLRRLT